MDKIFSGFCLTQKKDYQIIVKYIDTSTFDAQEHEKGTFDCAYNMYGNKCNIQCPIYSSAPDSI